jgi:hypothetical protein
MFSRKVDMKATTALARLLSSSSRPARLLATAWLVTASLTAQSADLKVKVLKACPDCVLPAAPEPCKTAALRKAQAATWTPTKSIRIHAVSIPEQSDIAIYTDIEVSTAPKMYLPEGHIFRVKYAGPAILHDPPCPGRRGYAGSNVTTTNIAFPSGTWISVQAGTPIYVHLDVKNWTSLEIKRMTQDVYIYYSE